MLLDFSFLRCVQLPTLPNCYCVAFITSQGPKRLKTLAKYSFLLFIYDKQSRVSGLFALKGGGGGGRWITVLVFANLSCEQSRAE